jgi:hypothetical protein
MSAMLGAAPATANPQPAPAAPAAPHIVSFMGQGGGNPTDPRANWTWDDWNTKDPSGLEALGKNPASQAQYSALYKAKYNALPDFS